MENRVTSVTSVTDKEVKQRCFQSQKKKHNFKKIYSGVEEMNKKIMEISLSVVCVVLCVCCLFTGCGKSAPKSLYESNTVEVIRNGSKTAVYDLVADKQYNLHNKTCKAF